MIILYYYISDKEILKKIYRDTWILRTKYEIDNTEQSHQTALGSQLVVKNGHMNDGRVVLPVQGRGDRAKDGKNIDSIEKCRQTLTWT